HGHSGAAALRTAGEQAEPESGVLGLRGGDFREPRGRGDPGGGRQRPETQPFELLADPVAGCPVGLGHVVDHDPPLPVPWVAFTLEDAFAALVEQPPAPVGEPVDGGTASLLGLEPAPLSPAGGRRRPAAQPLARGRAPGARSPVGLGHVVAHAPPLPVPWVAFTLEDAFAALVEQPPAPVGEPVDGGTASLLGLEPALLAQP